MIFQRELNRWVFAIWQLNGGWLSNLTITSNNDYSLVLEIESLNYWGKVNVGECGLEPLLLPPPDHQRSVPEGAPASLPLLVYRCSLSQSICTEVKRYIYTPSISTGGIPLRVKKRDDCWSVKKLDSSTSGQFESRSNSLLRNFPLS